MLGHFHAQAFSQFLFVVSHGLLTSHTVIPWKSTSRTIMHPATCNTKWSTWKAQLIDFWYKHTWANFMLGFLKFKYLLLVLKCLGFTCFYCMFFMFWFFSNICSALLIITVRFTCRMMQWKCPKCLSLLLLSHSAKQRLCLVLLAEERRVLSRCCQSNKNLSAIE